ncbi:hypothetical protein EVAR_24569_1 [Eumeta japonica]|uniref:Uncharacterized protein n=1 Tax=Eumeta variegata TaxID=151549 RepID=A0A4C1W6I9_EUMVA|nr:hypothetical protein EVAR_24569_1 [Eumeta japonica]
MKMFGKILLLGASVFVWLGEANDMKECGKLFHPESRKCCKITSVKLNLGDNIKECIDAGKVSPLPSGASNKSPTCDLDMCLAEKRGILNDQGAIDKDKLKKAVETEFSSVPGLVEKIIKKCIEGDVSKYAPSDFCELINIRNCMMVQAYNECPDWDDTDANCKEIKNLIEKCEA